MSAMPEDNKNSVLKRVTECFPAIPVDFNSTEGMAVITAIDDYIESPAFKSALSSVMQAVTTLSADQEWGFWKEYLLDKYNTMIPVSTATR